MLNPLSMADQCEICTTFTDELLILPCREQHMACRSCLLQTFQPLCKSIRCHQCRKTNVWIDVDSLPLKGTTPKRQKCSLCNPANAGVAENFCGDCNKRLCVRCDEAHDRLFKRSKRHKSVRCEDTNQLLLLEARCCTVVGHADQIIDVACDSCYTTGCYLCAIQPDLCEGETKHNYGLLECQLERVKTVYLTADRLLNTRHSEVDSKLKTLLGTMENFRLNTDIVIKELQSDILGAEPETIMTLEVMIETVKRLLREKSEDVTVARDGYQVCLNSISNLRNVIEAVLELSHPVDLLNASQELLNAVKKALKDEPEEVEFIPITLVQPADQDAPNGKSMLTGKLPTNLLHLQTVASPESCLSVCYGEAQDMIHGGKGYLSVLGVRQDLEGSNSCHCIRQEIFQKEMLMQVSSSGYSAKICVRNLDTMAIKHEFDVDVSRPFGKVAKVGDKICLSRSAFYSPTIDIYQVTTGKKVAAAKLDSNEEIYSASVQCDLVSTFEGEVFFSRKGSIFELDVEQASTRQIFKGDQGNIAAITYHHHRLYFISPTTSYAIKWLYIMTTKGKLLKKLKLPDLSGDIEDMSINSVGHLAVANGSYGVQIYQLEC